MSLISYDNKGKLDVMGRRIGLAGENLVGRVYGYQEVVGFDRVDSLCIRHWVCRCLVCGAERSFRSDWIKHGATCLNCKSIKKQRTRYGKFLLNQEDIARFHNGYTPVTESGCWLWNGSANVTGYGTISVHTDTGIKAHLAHRVSWAIHHGTLPDLLVCHTCDVPCCVNPDHLFLGTNQDNMNDKVLKRRHRQGESCYGSKLTEKDIKEIRDLYNVFGQSRIAKLYGVSNFTISCIIRRTKWSHV